MAHLGRVILFQLSSKGEVNSGDCLPGRGASSYISSAVNLPSGGGGGCFSIYHISWIK